MTIRTPKKRKKNRSSEKKKKKKKEKKDWGRDLGNGSLRILRLWEKKKTRGHSQRRNFRQAGVRGTGEEWGG